MFVWNPLLLHYFICVSSWSLHHLDGAFFSHSLRSLGLYNRALNGELSRWSHSHIADLARKQTGKVVDLKHQLGQEQ